MIDPAGVYYARQGAASWASRAYRFPGCGPHPATGGIRLEDQMTYESVSGRDLEGEHEEPDETPPAPRPRMGSRIEAKLDEILAHVKGDGDGDAESGGQDGDGTPEVSFRPEPSQLPVTSGPEDDPGASEDGSDSGSDSGAGTGEGSANLARPRAAFRHPSNRRFADVVR